MLADGEAALEWLAQRASVESGDVVLWGLSLGGAIAVHCAAEFGARALILDRTFADMVKVAEGMFPWAPIRKLMRNRFPSDQRITRYHGPLLVIHGPNDEIVPYESGRALFESCFSKDKRFLTLENFGHLDPPTPEFYSAIGEFLDAIEITQTA